MMGIWRQVAGGCRFVDSPTDRSRRAARRLRVLLAAALCLLPLSCAPRVPDPREVGIDVLPKPKEVHFEQKEFVIDEYAVLLVSSEATEWTRRAALVIQREVRERYGIELPLVRIVDQPKMKPTKPIWIVEPRVIRPPSKTIGVRGLQVEDEMLRHSYFFRSDYLEVVIHGTDDSGTWYGAHAFLQLLRPPVPGSLFRKARPATVPRLWLRDFPVGRERPIPASFGLPRDPKEAERFLAAAARYRLNAMAASVIPSDPDTAAYIRELAQRYYIQVVDELPKSAPCPYPFALEWAKHGEACRLTLAALGEAQWGGAEPDAEAFIRRFARDTFGTEGSVRALQFAREHLRGWLGYKDPAALAPAVAKGIVPDAVRDEIAAIRRAVRGIRAGLKDVTFNPGVRDAFLAGADRALCNAENSFVLLEAGQLYKRGKAGKAVRALRERLPRLDALGDDAARARKALERWIALFEAAAEAEEPPTLHELVVKGWGK